MLYFFIVLVAYMLGSVPCGLILTKMMGRGDLRKVGSGNIGATNVMRVGGLRMAGLVWILDMLKAIIAVLLGSWIGGIGFGAWCGFFAIIGHCFPIWLKFHGGKGISCLFGILLAVNPIMFVVCGIEWLIVALSSGKSSAGAVVVFCLLPVLGFVMNTSVGWAFLAIGILCAVRHRDNIVRLINGTESTIEWKWKK
ncbi:MAG: glycerol-3-phosphate 1-O-acyltransferase PlsY [Alphaproteobacteria bacterium]|nr:glycerol-3-phosphate 1-O-acyltransferase PlsY [Alphaproteobacteria bacterium]